MGSLIRVESGHLAGSGHLSRARALSRLSSGMTIVNRGSAQENCLNLPDDLALVSELDRLPDADLLVLDFSCDPILKNDPAELMAYLGGLRQKFKNVLLIDGLAQGSLVHSLSLSENITEFVDRLIVPYPLDLAFKKISKTLTGAQFFGGLEYFVFGEGFLNVCRQESGAGDYILVSFGGSDPWGMSEGFIQLLEALPEYSFKVIQGPSFNRELTSPFAHVEILKNHSNLAPLIQNASWLVTYPALTRYEAAFLGVPSMVVSPNENWQRLNQQFMNLEAGVDLGIQGALSLARMADAFGDAQLSKQLSRNAKELFSGYSLELIKKVYLNEQ